MNSIRVFLILGFLVVAQPTLASCRTNTALGFGPDPEELSVSKVMKILADAYRQYRSDRDVKALPVWRLGAPYVPVDAYLRAQVTPESKLAAFDHLISSVKAHGEDSVIVIHKTGDTVKVCFHRWVSMQRSVPEESLFRREWGSSVSVSMSSPTLVVDMKKILDSNSEEEVQTAFADVFERARLVPLQ